MKGQRRRIALMLAICIMLPCAACGGQKAPDPTPVPAEAPALTETPTPYPELTEAPKPSPAPTETPAPVSYADTLFDTGCVHRVDVIISDEDWAELLAAPIDKTKYHASVSIDGESIENVSFATKGNSSLYYVADDPGSERYSFRLNYGCDWCKQGACDDCYVKQYKTLRIRLRLCPEADCYVL